jgi:hypothetical protein
MPKETHITHLTFKNGAEVVDGALEKLAEYAATLGLGVKQEGKWGLFRDGKTMELKIRFVVGGEEGIEAKQRESFNDFAKYYDLEPGDFGAIITSRGKQYKLIGFNTHRRAKYPYRFIEIGSGKEVSFTDLVKHSVIAARK